MSEVCMSGFSNLHKLFLFLIPPQLGYYSFIYRNFNFEMLFSYIIEFIQQLFSFVKTNHYLIETFSAKYSV